MRISIFAGIVWLYGAVAAAQTAPNWTRQIPQNFPGLRYAHAMAYDSSHGQTVVFGGSNGAFLNDTWVWDGANWTDKSPQTSPPARVSPAMAFDSAHGQVVMFGGQVSGFSSNGNFILLNDTWIWDGANWTEMSPATSPPPRLGHAMAYDAAHGRVVLFGGFDPSDNGLNDTWLWDGSTWLQQSPATNPSVRGEHALAYDSAHGQVVLFAGYYKSGISQGPLQDTWTWNGSNWTQQTPSTSPPLRFQHAMAFDSAHGQVVMFGGAGSTISSLNDTWLWDGSNWTQQSPQDSPSARVGQAMAYDSSHDQSVLFGGLASSGTYLEDTWTFDAGPLPPMAPSIGSVVSASSYGGFTSVSPGSFVEIYGSNLAPATRGWTLADFTGNQAPTALDGVQVSIADQSAFVNYIVANPGQVNVQLPSNIPTGTQQITVMNKNGTSAPFNVTVKATEPGLLAPASFSVGGKQYAVAFHSDNVTYVLPAGAIAGIPSRPAAPGETIVMYGNGFGPVGPSIPAGQLVQEPNQLAASLEISFGGTPGTVAYDGLATGLVGVYQFDVTVPAIADNDLVPLTFKLGGVAGAQTLYTAVKK